VIATENRLKKNCSLLTVEALTLNVTAFGDKDFKR
jgi:hypothetical protein